MAALSVRFKHYLFISMKFRHHRWRQRIQRQPSFLWESETPMARPLWSGSIQISLVGFAVEIYPATNTTKPFSFHEIDRNTMTRVKRQSVSAGPASAEDAGDTPEAEEPPPANPALHLAR